MLAQRFDRKELKKKKEKTANTPKNIQINGRNRGINNQAQIIRTEKYAKIAFDVKKVEKYLRY
jgi:hypothetical protein